MASSFPASTLSSPTGAQLRVYAHSPQGPVKAVIQINHGLAEHAARYERFAGFLNSRGYAVIAHDHRGHGFTKAPDAPLGTFAARNGLDAVIADVGAVNAHARTHYPGIPIVCFGHSMGALIAFNYVLRHANTVAAAAIWNTNFETSLLFHIGRLLLMGERMLKGSDVPSSLGPKLTFDAWNKEFSPNRTAFDWLSRDAAEVDKYVADPLCGFACSVGLWLDVLSAVSRAANRAAIGALPKQLPFHLCAGALDPASNKGKGIETLAARLQGAGLGEVTLKVHPDTRHEGLNEINRDAIMAEFADWLDARFA